MRVLRWLDTHLHVVPVLAALATLGFFLVWRIAQGEWVALSGQPATQRSQLYSALAGAASGLLGFTLAALSILVAFGRAAEQRLRIGTAGLVKVLLSTSLLLLVTMSAALVSLGVDSKAAANAACATLTVAAGAANLIGLLLSLGAFSLAVLANQGR